jgi:hypothetical protein
MQIMIDVIRRCCWSENVEATPASDTCTMVSKQGQGMCNIHKAVS